MEEARLELPSCVRGHHIYKTIWSPFLGERLECIPETTNRKDPYAVSVEHNRTIDGHLPRKINAGCSSGKGERLPVPSVEKGDTPVTCHRAD